MLQAVAKPLGDHTPVESFRCEADLGTLWLFEYLSRVDCPMQEIISEMIFISTGFQHMSKRFEP